MSLAEILSNTKASELIEEGRVLHSVTRETTVGQTLQILADHRLLSVPVKNQDSQFTDFVDVLDIVSFLVTCCKNIDLVKNKVEAFTEHQVGNIISNIKKK